MLHILQFANYSTNSTIQKLYPPLLFLTAISNNITFKLPCPNRSSALAYTNTFLPVHYENVSQTQTATSCSKHTILSPRLQSTSDSNIAYFPAPSPTRYLSKHVHLSQCRVVSTHGPTYSATTLYLICQFRVKPTNDADTADAIATMHNNGVAPTFIKSLLSAILQSQPVPPTLQNAIDFEDVHFVSLSGDSPNYSVQFRAKITLQSAEVDFARFGSDR